MPGGEGRAHAAALGGPGDRTDSRRRTTATDSVGWSRKRPLPSSSSPGASGRTVGDQAGAPQSYFGIARLVAPGVLLISHATRQAGPHPAVQKVEVHAGPKRVLRALQRRLLERPTSRPRGTGTRPTAPRSNAEMMRDRSPSLAMRQLVARTRPSPQSKGEESKSRHSHVDACRSSNENVRRGARLGLASTCTSPSRFPRSA